MTLSATAVGGQQAVYKFKAGYEDDAGWHWSDLNSYNSSSTCTWTPAISAKYTLVAMARENGDTENYAAFSSMQYTVAANVTAVALTVSPSSPQTEDSPITLSAAPTSSTAAELKFRAGYLDGNNIWQWSDLSGYSSSASCVWTPTAAQNYIVVAWARDAGSPTTYQQADVEPFPVTPSLTGVTLTTVPVNPTTVNQIVRLIATPVLANPLTVVEYKFRLGTFTSSGDCYWSDLSDYSTSGTATWQPTVAGNYQLLVWAREQGHTVDYDEEASQSVTISIYPPSANSQSVQLYENSSLDIYLTASDPSDILLTFAPNQPSNGELLDLGVTDITSDNNVPLCVHEVIYTPHHNYSGYDFFQFLVTDGCGNITMGSVLIDVIPVITADSQTITVPNSYPSPGLAIYLTGNDAQGKPLYPLVPNESYTSKIIQSPTHGQLDPDDPEDLTPICAENMVYYTPDPTYFGKDYFTYEIMQGTISSLPATVSIIVLPAPPVAYGQGVNVDENSTDNQITLTASDPYGWPLTYTITGEPSNGTLDQSQLDTTQTVSYTPVPGYVGFDSFTFTVNDGYQDIEYRNGGD